MKLSAIAVLLVSVALLAAGCGGSGSGSSSGSSGSGAPATGGAAKKATAPNAPAGSKVVSCKEGAAGMTQLRATAVGCGVARQTMQGWGHSHACTLGQGSSRSSCSLGSFRCQAVRVDGGAAAVSCARSGGDVSFIAGGRPLRKRGGG